MLYFIRIDLLSNNCGGQGGKLDDITAVFCFIEAAEGAWRG